MKENIDDLEADSLDPKKGSEEHKSTFFFISGISLALITLIVKLMGPRDFLGIENKTGYYGAIFFAGILSALLFISIAIYLSGAIQTENNIEESSESEVNVVDKKDSFESRIDKKER
ncbi:MAG: hypothetical protein ACLFVB_09095 [Thermoplasmata archaeon]